MTKYERYEAKALRINKIVNFLYRSRVFLITITSAIVIGSITFAASEGKITVGENETTFVYGNEVSFTTSAFVKPILGEEYKTADGEAWTSEKPYKVGEYVYRSFSENGFGNRTYSDEIEFSIVPRQASVNIPDSSVIYGEKPRVSCSLFGTDKVSNYSINYENIYSNKTNAEINRDDFVILNNNGEDVTFCYDITFNSKELFINKRPLTIKYKDQEKIYDGEAVEIFDGEITSGSLAEGDEIVYDKEGLNFIEPGVSLYKEQFKIMHGETDVTGMYIVNDIEGKTEIKKIPYEIKSTSKDFIYNGKTIGENDACEIIFDCDLLLENHHFNASFDEGFLNNYKVGEYDAIFDYEIVDNEGNDVSQYYYLKSNIVYGIVEISKRDLSIQFSSSEKLFDTATLKNQNYELNGEIAETDRIVFENSEYPEITLPGEILNSLGSVAIYRNEEDITSCYNLVVNTGILKINKPHITFNMPCLGEIVYDGKPHYLTDFSVDTENSDEIYSLFDFTFNSNEILPLYDVGTYTAEGSTITVSKNDVDYTSCFDIEYVFNESKVLEREITIDFEESSLVYTGEFVVVGNVIVGGDGLAENELIRLTSIEDCIRVGTYNLEDLGFKIFDSQNDEVTSNYKVTEYTEVEVEPKVLNIVLPTDEKVYDGLDHNVELDLTQFTNNNSLGTGDSITYESLIMNEVDEYAFDDSKIHVIASNLDDVTDCYSFVFENKPAISNITKKKITVTVADFESTYNGATQSTNISVTDGSLISGDRLSVTTLSAKNAGTYKKSDFADLSDFKILNSSGKDVTKNYEINTNFDSFDFKINQATLKVKFNMEDFTYDGKDHSYTEDDVEFFDSTSLLGSDTFVLVENTIVTAHHVGTFTPNNMKIKIINNKEDVSGNYNITYDYDSSFKVKQKEIEVTIKSYNPEYTGVDFATTFKEKQSDLVTYSYTGGLADGTEVDISPISNDIFIGEDGIAKSLSDLVSVTLKNTYYPQYINDYSLKVNYGSCKYQLKKASVKVGMTKMTYNASNELKNTSLSFVNTDLYHDISPIDVNKYVATLNGDTFSEKAYKVSINFDNVKIQLKSTKQDVTKYFDLDSSGECLIGKKAVSFYNPEEKYKWTGSDFVAPEKILTKNTFDGNDVPTLFNNDYLHTGYEKITNDKESYEYIRDNVKPRKNILLMVGDTYLQPGLIKVWRYKAGSTSQKEKEVTSSYNITFTRNYITIYKES